MLIEALDPAPLSLHCGGARKPWAGAPTQLFVYSLKPSHLTDLHTAAPALLSSFIPGTLLANLGLAYSSRLIKWDNAILTVMEQISH